MLQRLIEGLSDFGTNAGVPALKLPTPDEAKEIKREIDALPPLGWLHTNDSAMIAVANAHFRQRRAAAVIAAQTGAFNSILPLDQGGGGMMGIAGVELPSEG